MNNYLIELKTDKNIGSKEFVDHFIKDWFQQGVKLRPEFYDQGEPVKKSFNKNGIEDAIQLWISEQLPLMFKRKKVPAFLMDIDWRSVKGKDKRHFPWGCTVWLNNKAGDKVACQLFEFLCKHFEPVFGFITTEQDYNAKHFVSLETQMGLVEKYEGTEVQETIPGVYWKTFFGDRLIKTIGKTEFSKISSDKSTIINDGILLTPYQYSKIIGSEEGERREKEIKNILGMDLFFEKKKIGLKNFEHLTDIVK